MSSPIRIVWASVPPGAARREVAWELLLAEIGGSGIQLSNPCPFCGGPHGPVQVHGAAVTASVSYAAGFAVAAIAPVEAGRVGVDAAAAVDLQRDAAGLGGVLGPGSRPSVRDWVRVEAALKADQRGLRIEPGQVRVTLDAEGWRAEAPSFAAPIRGEDRDGPAGILVSAALRPSPGSRR